MENYSYSSYPDSHDSSPRSRDNESWDDQQPSSNYKVKFMCSYGGKIHPRPHDNQLTYVGGETKIIAVDRNIRFSSIISKLSSFCDIEVCFKYQLPGEDLDALISVTNDEDLEHMMLEYDRIYRVGGGGGGSRPARLRLFLFPLNSSNQSSFSADDPKPSQQWFVDALNAVPVQSLDSSSPPASATNTDFLFGGFEKPQQPQATAPPVVAKLVDSKTELIAPEAKLVVGPEAIRDVGAGGEMFEIQRQIHELQRLQIVNQEQQQQQQQNAQHAFFQRKNEQPNMNLPRGAFHGGQDYYIPDKQQIPTSVPVSLPPSAYWQDRHAAVTGSYPDQMTGPDRQQQVYLMQPQAGMYQTPGPGPGPGPGANMRQQQVTGHVSQGYYGIQRVVSDVYREQPVYSVGPPQMQQQQPQPAPPQPQMTKMMVGETGGGYTTAQVGYDSSGRQVYYATTGAVQPGGGAVGVVPSSYPTAVTTMTVDPRQAGTLSPEGKIVKPPQASV